MDEFKQKMAGVIEHLKEAIVTLRTGRATPAIVEDIEVDYYGTPTPIKALASISSPEPRQLTIQPWDKNALQPIEKAIQGSSLGLSPITERDIIRITIPAMTEERRVELTKLLGRHVEDARIHVRREREETLRTIDRQEESKEITEDEKFMNRDQIQKIVEETNNTIDQLREKKEKEMMTV